MKENKNSPNTTNMNYEEIKYLNENQVHNLFKQEKITRSVLDEFYSKTSVYQRNLANNSLFDCLKQPK